jgi:hypothetical protein
MPDISTILQLLAAGGVGGLIVQYVGKGPDRRAARADVRKALSAVEIGRWNTPADREQDDFSDQLRTLMTSAMVAQLPRSVVDRYIYAAQAARAALVEARKAEPDLASYRVGLSREINDYVNAVRDLLVDHLWRPNLEKLRLRRRLQALDATRTALRSDMSGPGRYLGYEYWPV